MCHQECGPFSGSSPVLWLVQVVCMRLAPFYSSDLECHSILIFLLVVLVFWCFVLGLGASSWAVAMSARLGLTRCLPLTCVCVFFLLLHALGFLGSAPFRSTRCWPTRSPFLLVRPKSLTASVSFERFYHDQFNKQVCDTSLGFPFLCFIVSLFFISYFPG